MNNTAKYVLLGCGGILILGILIIAMAFWRNYNRLVTMDEGVTNAWAQVENQLKRRTDLIPNLVNTVKGYAAHEKEIFTQVAEARTKLAGARTVKDKIAASNTFEGALSRLLLIVERYPDLKASEQFKALQYELSGTENRIATERKRYNDSVKLYNTYIKRVPGRFFAAIFGFSEKPYFEVSEADKELPEVKF